MKERKLLLAIGELDESYIAELQTFVQGRTGKRKRPRAVLLAAVIAALALTLTAGAVGIALGEEESWFHSFFAQETMEYADAVTECQLDLLERGLVELDKSTVCSGYTVTLGSALCDGHRLLAKITVEAPEGVALEGDRYGLAAEFEPVLPDGAELPFRIMTGGCSQLEDGDGSDGLLTFLLDVRLQPKPEADISLTQGMEWNIRITGILRDHGGAEDYYVETVASGEWDLTFRLSSDTLLTQERELLEAPVWVSGRRALGSRYFPVTVKLTSVKFRSLSMTWCYDEPLTGYWEGIFLGDVYVVLKDGTRILADYDMGSNMNGYWRDTFLFPVPVAQEDIAYVELPGGHKLTIG